MDPFDPGVIGAAYDAVAEEYLAEFGDDLADLPVDRGALDDLTARLDGRGPVLDVGCGPGQVGRFLAARSVAVVGVDLALRMLTTARGAGAGSASFVAADMRSLPIGDGTCAGLVAFYSVQHLARPELGVALGEFRRVLTAGGLLLIAAHLGTGTVRIDEFLGHAVEPFGGRFYTEAELTSAVDTAGLAVESTVRRDALSHEYPSERIYLLARAA